MSVDSSYILISSEKEIEELRKNSKKYLQIAIDYDLDEDDDYDSSNEFIQECCNQFNTMLNIWKKEKILFSGDDAYFIGNNEYSSGIVEDYICFNALSYLSDDIKNQFSIMSGYGYSTYVLIIVDDYIEKEGE